MKKTSAQPSRRKSSLKSAISLIALFGLFLTACNGIAGEGSMTEYQVKALFLLNFTKYVDWPAVSFAETNAPIIIGLYGENKFGDALKKTVEGKTISGRGIVVRTVVTDGEPGKCHILFVSDSDRKRLGEILAKTRMLPVLTVGETDQFIEQGGVINFVKRDGKIRLEINLDAARQAHLEISPKLLNVADVVKGKTK